MLHYILQVVLFQLVFLLVYELLLKKETFFGYNRWYLLLTPIVALLLPLLKFEPLQTLVPTENLVMLPEVIIGGTAETTTYQITSTSFSNLFQINWWLIAYFSGLFFSLCLFLKKYFGLKKMFRFKIVSEENGLKIIEIPNSDLACTFFNTIFLGETLKSGEKEHILSHEMVHVNQKHSWDLIFFEVLKILFWFNPLTYIFQQKIAALHEFIADAQVIKTTERKTYYHQLLNTAFNTQNISFTNQFFKDSLIKKRIVMLQKSRSNTIAKYKYFLLFPLMFLMLIYVSCSSTNKKIAATTDNMENISKNEEATIEVEKVDEILDVPFAIVEQPPVFPGCEELTSVKAQKECFSNKLIEFVDANFNTEKMKAYSQTGINRIYVQFKITKTGNIEIVGIRGRTPQLEDEARRVMSKLPQMVPGKQSGNAVAVLYMLPIKFMRDE